MRHPSRYTCQGYMPDDMPERLRRRTATREKKRRQAEARGLMTLQRDAKELRWGLRLVELTAAQYAKLVRTLRYARDHGRIVSP